MAFSTRCCLNMSPPTPNPQLDNSCSNTKGSQVAWPRNDKWKTGCVIGLACMIIGLEASDVSKTSAVAEEIPTVFVLESNSRVARWSDKRMCPPWQANSLETIVPENLPRPSARRKWEGIGFSNNAPATKVTIARETRAGCFSM
ncbi:hypothetical protein Gotur_010370 [Gossypium turneri]